MFDILIKANASFVFGLSSNWQVLLIASHCKADAFVIIVFRKLEHGFST